MVVLPDNRQNRKPGPSDRAVRLGLMGFRASTADLLLSPVRLWSRPEVLVKDCPVPGKPGVYAWYFRETPPGVPIADCRTAHGATLLYVGGSPKRPGSTQHLRKRIRYHYRGNAYGSTLRLTLGLLESVIGTRLVRVGTGGKRLTFAKAETLLSEWMEKNALVTWQAIEEPWLVEEKLIEQVSLPLNLDQSRHHAFHAELSLCLRDAKERARAGPLV